MFNVRDPNINVNPDGPDGLTYFRRRGGPQRGKGHVSAICQACIENKQCGVKRKEPKKNKKKRRGRRNRSSNSNTRTQEQEPRQVKDKRNRRKLVFLKRI